MAENRNRKLIGNTAIIAVGQFGSKVLVYLLTRLYTSLLSTEEYSVATNISDLASLLIPLISLGIGEAIFRLAKGDEYRQKEVFSGAFAIWLIGCAAFAVILPVLACVTYFSDYLWLITVYVLASVFHTICTNYIRAKGYVKMYAVQGIMNTAAVILLNIIFLIGLDMSSIGYVLSVPIADLLVTLFIIVKAKLYRDFDLREIRKSSVKGMLKYSVPLIPTTVFMWVVNISDRFMVTYFCGDAVNGLYSAAYKIPTLLGVLNSIFIYAWQISAMDERSSSDKRAYFTKTFRSYSAVMWILGAGIILFTKVITYLMFDSSYHDGWVYIPILTLAMVIHNFSSFLDSDNMVRLKSVPTMLTALAGAITNVVLNFVLIGSFDLGGMGAAVATYLSYMVAFVLRAVVVRGSIRVGVWHTVANNVFMLAMIAVIMTEMPLWYIVDALLLLVICALNFKDVLPLALALVPRKLKAKFRK